MEGKQSCCCKRNSWKTSPAGVSVSGSRELTAGLTELPRRLLASARRIIGRSDGKRDSSNMHIYVFILCSAIPCEHRLTFLVPDPGRGIHKHTHMHKNIFVLPSIIILSIIVKIVVAHTYHKQKATSKESDKKRSAKQKQKQETKSNEKITKQQKAKSKRKTKNPQTIRIPITLSLSLVCNTPSDSAHCYLSLRGVQICSHINSEKLCGVVQRVPNLASRLLQNTSTSVFVGQ